ncbi:MAG: tetraacyldisaccharide 4'-kinase [Candidatus Brocadiia bacterium]
MAALQERFLDYISGRRQGADAALVRSGLRLLSGPYWLACTGRLVLYNAGLLMSHELEARVLSVGNITTGGTGKTPMVIWLARWLQQRGIPTAILSRGYGPKAPKQAGQTDEMLIFRRYLPTVPHVVGKDRRRTGSRAIREQGVECLVLDDGFQHLAVGRDLDIVLVDSLMPFGFGHLLPRGLLREPLRGLRRADVVVLTRCDLCPKDFLAELHRTIQDVGGPGRVVESAHRPCRFYHHATEESRPLGWVEGRRAYAFSALGNPAAFPRTLETLGATVVHHRAFRDHHWYQPDDLRAIAAHAGELGADTVVTTEKDAVKIRSFPETAPPLYVLAVEFALTDGEDLLVDALEDVLSA